MGYTFVIGNAVPHFDQEDFPHLTARWHVERITNPSAPEFLNDTLTGKSNSRSPSYSGWADFCRSVGLYDFFFDSGGHLKAGHPGCIGITEGDWQIVRAALDKRRAAATLPPGFEKDYLYDGPDNYDYHLARLIWLEWWMRWALDNCETPAIENW